MIAYLEGQVRTRESGWIVLQTGGVGYKVFPVGCSPMAGQTVSLHIYDHIREDRRELFGFEQVELMQLFEQLLDISGVGPRLAQKMLSGGSSKQMTTRILAGDIDFLTSIPGVGKKTAQKIVLELKGVLVEPSAQKHEDNDTLEALIALGYKEKEAREVLIQLTEETTEARIKEALRKLST